MKKRRMIDWSRFIITSILVSICLLLSSTISLGDDGLVPSNVQQKTTDCRLSPDPEECYRQQSQGEWQDFDPASFFSSSVLSKLNSKALGLEGPLSFDLKYDTELSWIFGLNYIHMFEESLGLATKLTGGANEFRSNVTAGYAFSDNHQLKLSYEYLTQNLPFDFASGSIDEWVSQHSLGATYQYILRHEIVHSLELSGYITRAQSKDLSSVSYNQQMVSANDFLYDMNYRRIAGGNENTFLTSLNLFPFADKKTTLTLGVGYSQVGYDTQYENNDDGNSNNGVAYKVELTHILSPKAKIETSVNATASAREHKIKLSHLLPNHLEGTVIAAYTAGQVGLPDTSSISVGLKFPAPDSYTLGGFSDLQDFRAWVEKPVMYYNRVLAIKDEKVQSYEFKSNGTIPDQSKMLGQSLNPVQTNPYFAFSDPSLQVTYTVFTQKLFSNTASTAKSSSGRDYTSDLNLTIVPTTTNQAVLESANSTGFPAEDSTGQSTAGDYQITITGSGTSDSLSPIVLTNSFKLTLNGSGPSWNGSAITDANMGYVYPKDGEMDMITKVIVSAPDTSSTLEIADNTTCVHPAWLSLVSCKNNPNDQCLSSGSSVVPDSSADQTFCIRLKATGNSSGADFATYQTYTSNIIQVMPQWIDPQTPIISFDDTTTKISLGDSSTSNYIADGTRLGLAFQPGVGFDATHWIFNANDNSLQLKGPADLNYYGLKQIPIEASNSTSYGNATHNVLVNVTVPDAVVNWTDKPLIPDSVVVGDTYNYDLQSMGLVKTTINGMDYTSADTYTFNVAKDDPNIPGWSVNADGYLQYKDGKTSLPLPTSGGVPATIKLTLAAVSAISSSKSPIEKEFTITLTSNNSAVVTWTESPLKPAAVAVGDTYNYDLITMDLVHTIVGSTDLTEGDSYTFSVTQDDPNLPGWTVDSSNHLQYVDGATKLAPTSVPYTVHITLNVVSKINPNSQIAPKIFTIDIGAAGATVNWLDNSQLNPNSIPVNETYNADLQGMGLVKTTINGLDYTSSDTYIFSVAKDDPNVPGWAVDANGHLQYKNGEPLPPTVLPSTKITLTLHVVSILASSPADKIYTLTVVTNPALETTWTTNSISNPVAGNTFYYNLNTAGLLVTMNGSTTISDNYTFKEQAGTTDGFSVINNYFLTYKNNSEPIPTSLVGTKITIVLSATSQASGKSPSNGDSVTHYKTYTLTVSPNPAFNVTWSVNAPITPLVGNIYDFDFSVDASTAGTQALIYTTDGAGNKYGDVYSFTVDSSSQMPDADWQLTPQSGTVHLKYKDGKTFVPSSEYGKTIKVMFAQAGSQIAGKQATGGDSGGAKKTYTLTIGASDAVVSWTSETLNPNTVSAGNTYDHDLNTMGVVKTVANSVDITNSDTYTFSVTKDDPTVPGWSVNAAGHLQYKNGNTLLPLPPATITLTLHAYSALAAGSPSDKQFTLTLTTNSQATISWTSNPLNPNTVAVSNTYSYDLNGMGLVKTMNGSTDVTSLDQYSFSVAKDDPTIPGWAVNSSGYLQYKNGTTPLPLPTSGLPTTVNLTLHVVSAINPSGTPTDKAFTITVTTNTNAVIAWTGNPLNPSAVNVGDTYDYDLDGMNLVKTTLGSTDITNSDSYTFSVTQDDPSLKGWTVDSNNHLKYLDGNTPLNLSSLPYTLHITLSVTSKINPLGSPTATPFTIQIGVSGSVASWTNNPLNPNTVAVGNTYDHDLNTMGVVKTVANSVDVTSSDTYAFSVTKDDPTVPGWSVNAAGHLQYKNGTMPLPSTSSLPATITLTLHVYSALAAGAPTDRSFTLSLTTNTNATVSWTSNTLNPNSVAVGNTYDQALNGMGLVQTKVGSTDVTSGDIYTFSVTKDDPTMSGWRVSNGHLQYAPGSTVSPLPLPTSGVLPATIQITLHVVSATNPSASPQDKVFSITLTTNTNLTTTWTTNTPTQPVVDGVYKYDLNIGTGASPVPSTALVLTKNGSTTVGDTYAFQAQSGTTANWTVVQSGSIAYLQYVDGNTMIPYSLLGTTVKVILTAKSAASGKTATGGDSGGSQKTYTLTIGANPNLSVAWTTNKPTLPAIGNTYSYDLNTGAGNTPDANTALALTKNGSVTVGDMYIFQSQSGTTTDWKVTPSGNTYYLQYKDGNTIIPSSLANTTVTVVISALSQASNNSLSNNTYTWTLVPPPVWGTATGVIKFDITGDGNELGAITNGVQLNSSTMISNLSSFPGGITFTFDNGQTTYGDWQIKTSGSDTYLLRKRNTSATPATINSSDVGSTDIFPTTSGTNTFPAIKACSVSAPTNCSTSGGSNSSVKITVNPDSTLIYNYDTTGQPSSEVITSLTSDGNGVSYIYTVNASVKAPSFAVDHPPASVYTSSGSTRIVNDTNFVYLSPSNIITRSYIYYAPNPLGGVVTSITFDAPPTNDFVKLVNTPDADYMWAQSRASGDFTLGTGTSNLKHLPPITSNKLILVPDQRSGHVNQTFTNDNTSNNVIIGVDGPEYNCGFASSNHGTSTGLVFNLPTVAGKTYTLNLGSGTNYVGVPYLSAICSGYIRPKMDSNFNSTCAGKISSQYNTDTRNYTGSVVYSPALVDTKTGSTDVCLGAVTIKNFQTTAASGSTANLGTGGTFTVFLDALGLYDYNQAVPITYPDPNKKAPSFGSVSNNDYSSLPYVTVQ